MQVSTEGVLLTFPAGEAVSAHLYVLSSVCAISSCITEISRKRTCLSGHPLLAPVVTMWYQILQMFRKQLTVTVVRSPDTSAP